MPEITKEESILETENTESSIKSVSEEKFKRIIVALTVGAVVLLSVLITLMCYQLIKIGVENRRKSEYSAKIAELKELSDKNDKELEYLRTNAAIERLARELGYHYSDDIN